MKVIYCIQVGIVRLTMPHTFVLGNKHVRLINRASEEY